jgi:hypothetical protein
MTRAARRSNRAAAAARRRAASRSASLAVVVLALWLAVRLAAGAGVADYAAGVLTGAVAAVLIPAALSGPVMRWSRRAGVSARAAAARPVPRAQRPARTPIHDTAENAQRGA